MFTSLLDVSALWMPIVGALLLVGGYFLLVLFLYTITETLNKVRPENRDLEPGKVWLNLIPVFNIAWMFVTVSRLASSIEKEFESRDLEDRGDGGRKLGLGFAAACALTVVPGINLLAAPAALVLWVLYWHRVVHFGKRLENPGETIFWEKYNQRLEFPTSLAIATLTFSLMIFLGIFVLAFLTGGKDKSSIPIRLVEGGEDDEGQGSPGSGGFEDPLKKGEAAPKPEDFAVLPQQDLPKVQEDLKNAIALDDPNATASISEEKIHAYAALDDAIREKLIGQQRGQGPGAGRGDTGQFGKGPGGDGADSTRARSLRWILRFRTVDGKDYLMQLKSLGATVLVPLSSDRKQMYIFKDLDNPRPGTLATDADYSVLARQIQFSDFRRDSCRQVGEALRLDFVPTVFWAFFPAQIEKELARLEVAYRNRRPQDIDETVFQVTIRGGQYQLVVSEQRAKR